MSTHMPRFQPSGSEPSANSQRILKLMLLSKWLMVNLSIAKATFSSKAQGCKKMF